MKPSPISKQYSLRKKRDFVSLFRSGRRLDGRHFSLQVSRTDTARNRIACSVGKKIGNAVCRNRVKRRLREAYRNNTMYVKEGLDLLFIAKPAILAAGMADLESEMKRLFREIERT